MDKPTYPQFTDAMLVPFRAIEAQLKTWPDLLDRPDCPYVGAHRELIRRLCDKTQVKAASVYSEDDLEREITEVYEELKRVGLNVTGVDAKEKISLLKTSGDLLTKMVALKERMLNVRQMGQFQRAIVTVMESVLTPAQRSEFVEILGKIDHV